MSRDYEMECPECKCQNARRGHMMDCKDGNTYYALQCMDCGACFLEITTDRYVKLKTKGIDQDAYDDAWNEAWKIQGRLKPYPKQEK